MPQLSRREHLQHIPVTVHTAILQEHLRCLLTEQQVDAKPASASTHIACQSEINGGHIQALMPGKVVSDTYHIIYVQETDEHFRLSGLPR